MRSITMPLHAAAASLPGLLGLAAVAWAALGDPQETRGVAWMGLTLIMIASVVYLRGALQGHVEEVLRRELANSELRGRLAAVPIQRRNGDYVHPSHWT